MAVGIVGVAFEDSSVKEMASLDFKVIAKANASRGLAGGLEWSSSPSNLATGLRARKGEQNDSGPRQAASHRNLRSTARLGPPCPLYSLLPVTISYSAIPAINASWAVL